MKFPLCMGEPRNVPILYDMPGMGCFIEGEVYQVNNSVLQGLDELEGVATGFYSRQEIQVQMMKDDQKPIKQAWVYTQNGNSSDIKGRDDLVPCYTREMHASYEAKEANADLLRLFTEQSLPR